MPERRLSISVQDCAKGGQSTSVRIGGLWVLCDFCEAIGCDREKPTIESPEEISFFLGINTEVNEREVMGRQVQNERIGR
jgi:hypothetical protein